MARPRRKVQETQELSPQQRGAITRKNRQRAGQRRTARFKPADSVVDGFGSLRELIERGEPARQERHEMVVDRDVVRSATTGFTSFITDRLIDSQGDVDPTIADILVLVAELIRGANSANAITLTFKDAV